MGRIERSLSVDVAATVVVAVAAVSMAMRDPGSVGAVTITPSGGSFFEESDSGVELLRILRTDWASPLLVRGVHPTALLRPDGKPLHKVFSTS